MGAVANPSSAGYSFLEQKKAAPYCGSGLLIEAEADQRNSFST